MNNNATHSRLCSQIVGVIRKRGGYAKPIAGGAFQSAGTADILGCFAGCFLSLEVKTGKARPTKLQIHERNLVRRAGGVAEIVRYVEEVENILDQLAVNGKSYTH